MPSFRPWHDNCVDNHMWKKIRRLFIIKTKFEAFLITYALATGAVARGQHYLVQYPGWGGKLLFLAVTGAVFMAGAKMIEAVELNRIYNSDY